MNKVVEAGPAKAATRRPAADRQGDTRRQIVSAAVLLIADQGYSATSVEEIAVAAGVTERTGLVTRPLAASGAWRTLGLAWRPNAPRAADYRALAPHLAETCRDHTA